MPLLRPCCLVFALLLSGVLASEAFAERVRITLADGSRWRGEIGTTVTVTYKVGRRSEELTGALKSVERDYILVTVDGSGDTPIFMTKIVSIEAADDAEPVVDPTPGEPAGDGTEDGTADETEQQPADIATTPDVDRTLPESLQFDPAKGLPIFYLPMEGGVGQEFREEEIRAMGLEMDELGPGQTLVLHITSPGGLVAEWELIWQTIKHIKKKHRVVAWVKTAISAGASTSLACSCIVFETSGALGSITTLYGGGQEAPMSMQLEGIANLEKVLLEGGYSKHFARAFKLNDGLLSYDKDPDTGAVTFYPDVSGDFILSDGTHVLTIAAREAEDCGFAIGIADTRDELASLLDMGGWNEVGTGQETFDRWQRDCKDCEDYIQRYGAKLKRLNTQNADDLGEAIIIIRKLLTWWDRAPNICWKNNVPSKDDLKLLLEELQLRLRNMRRR